MSIDLNITHVIIFTRTCLSIYSFCPLISHERERKTTKTTACAWCQLCICVCWMRAVIKKKDEMIISELAQMHAQSTLYVCADERRAISCSDTRMLQPPWEPHLSVVHRSHSPLIMMIALHPVLAPRGGRVFSRPHLQRETKTHKVSRYISSRAAWPLDLIKDHDTVTACTDPRTLCRLLINHTPISAQPHGNR